MYDKRWVEGEEGVGGSRAPHSATTPLPPTPLLIYARSGIIRIGRCRFGST